LKDKRGDYGFFGFDEREELMMNETISWVLLVLAAANVILLVVLLFRKPKIQPANEDALREELRAGREEANRAARESRDELSKGLKEANDTLSTTLNGLAQVQGTQLAGMTKQLTDLSESNHQSLAHMRTSIDTRVKELQDGNEKKLEQMRTTVDEKIKGNQDELSKGLAIANETLSVALMRMGEFQKTQLEEMTKQLKELSESNQGSLDLIRTAVDSRVKELQEGNEKKFEEIRKTIDERLADNREELSKGLKSTDDRLSMTLKSMGETQSLQLNGMTQQLKELAESNQSSLDRVRTTIDLRVKELQDGNDKKLEEMRKTVDEKLHDTLERRLGESFKLVSDRLEAVQRGLGEMQNLATGVGDLQRVLSNVKVRGTWTEVQLGALLEQILAPGQYEKNVRVKVDSRESVEYAIRLPGQKLEPGSCLWLPIDAKFPQEDYRRVQEAAERGDPEATKRATDDLARTIRAAAQQIHEKYINPPTTTDFAIMFLATEGLYGEALRHDSLVEDLQTRYRIVVAGPTTLAAILSSLRMGFQTLAIEQRASEVGRVLGAVKTEFGKFGEVLAKIKRHLDSATHTIEDAHTRTRVMERRLRAVEQLPEAEATAVLDLPEIVPPMLKEALDIEALDLSDSEECDTALGVDEASNLKDAEVEETSDFDDIPF
jgi:DNA recombination protein RmuC